MSRRRTCALWAVLAMSLGLLALVVLFIEVLARPPDPGRLEELFAARDTWVRRPFTSYRLITEQEGALQPRCSQEVEIRDEQIVNIISNSCATPVVTVSDMFARIEEHNTKVICGANGCECDGRIVARATYDATLGYPRSLIMELEPQRRLFPWLRLFDRPCTLIGFVGDPTITVVTLTPLP